jgi:hypothetical protein
VVQRSRLSTGLSGVAGEYLVAAELSRRGYIASITLRNTRGIDILASNADATRSVGIQVKTNQRASRSWMLSEKIERPVQGELAENLFFVFVCLNDLGAPAFHIVSRKEVARYCQESHRRWLEAPGRKGRPHRDNPVRRFEDPEERYLNKWEALGLGENVVAHHEHFSTR